MRVVLAQPRGFCAGVIRAIEIVEATLANDVIAARRCFGAVEVSVLPGVQERVAFGLPPGVAGSPKTAGAA